MLNADRADLEAVVFENDAVVVEGLGMNDLAEIQIHLARGLTGPDQHARPARASGSVLLSVMLVTAPALSMGEIPLASAERSAALETKADP